MVFARWRIQALALAGILLATAWRRFSLRAAGRAGTCRGNEARAESAEARLQLPTDAAIEARARRNAAAAPPDGEPQVVKLHCDLGVELLVMLPTGELTMVPRTANEPDRQAIRRGRRSGDEEGSRGSRLRQVQDGFGAAVSVRLRVERRLLSAHALDPGVDVPGREGDARELGTRAVPSRPCRWW